MASLLVGCAVSVMADDCLAAVNKYRQMAGKTSIQSCGASEQNKAQQQSKWDEAHGWHNWVNTKGWAGTCTSGAVGQCEAQGCSTQECAIKMYYKEGPTGGHYKTMMSDKAHCVACGESGKLMTHNFCVEKGAKVDSSLQPTSSQDSVPSRTSNSTGPSESSFLLEQDNTSGDSILVV
jgi:hypothetical protein